jgi:anti-sigma B factor antagonist
VVIDGNGTDGAGTAALGLSRLELHDRRTGPRHTLVLTGELDVASASALDATLHEICTDATDALALDLSALTFMDSSGLRLVLLARDLCQRHGCEFMLIPGPAQVQRLFEVTGLIEQLPFVA